MREKNATMLSSVHGKEKPGEKNILAKGLNGPSEGR